MWTHHFLKRNANGLFGLIQPLFTWKLWVVKKWFWNETPDARSLECAGCQARTSRSRQVMLAPSSCQHQCWSRQGDTGFGWSYAAACWEVRHDVSQSRDKAWAFLAGWEGLIHAVVLTSICKDCSTGIIQLSIMVFNQGRRTRVPWRKAIDALPVFLTLPSIDL